MKDRLRKYIMLKGITLFADYTPTWVLRTIFKTEDHCDIRNKITSAAHLSARADWGK